MIATAADFGPWQNWLTHVQWRFLPALRLSALFNRWLWGDLKSPQESKHRSCYPLPIEGFPSPSNRRGKKRVRGLTSSLFPWATNTDRVGGGKYGPFFDSEQIEIQAPGRVELRNVIERGRGAQKQKLSLPNFVLQTKKDLTNPPYSHPERKLFFLNPPSAQVVSGEKKSNCGDPIFISGRKCHKTLEPR